MMNHFHWMTIDGKPSRDFDVYISGAGTYSAPERSYEEVEVPGRNGTIFLYDDNYKNIEVTYNAWIGKIDGQDEVDKNFRNLRSFLLSREGYFRIEDTYHPDEFRFATFVGPIDADVEQGLQAASFEMTFNCKPQRFLKKYYDFPIEITESGYTFLNETWNIAKPLIRAYGTGDLYLGNTVVTITSAEDYTDIDCELQEAYRDTLADNRNSCIKVSSAVRGRVPSINFMNASRGIVNMSSQTLASSGVVSINSDYVYFPELLPGENTILFNGLTKIELYPRLFML